MTRANQTPEQAARENIDRLLTQAGRAVQDKKGIDPKASLGLAIREYQTDVGPADYVLCIDRKPVGVVEAKPKHWGQKITTVEEQSGRYASAKLKWVSNSKPLPFVYESTGVLTRFTDGRDPRPRSREVFNFPRPETMQGWYTQLATLRARLQALPSLDPTGLRACQVNAIEGRRRGNRVKEAIRRKDPTHCYLCGHPLSRPTSKDHCPPRALFPSESRQQHNLSKLITIRVHEDCNTSYTRDEEYFKATVVPFAPGSEAGEAVYNRLIEDYRNKEGKRQLAEKVLRQFETRPSGLHLPEGRVIMRIEGTRVARVAWKIVRGLYFHHHSTILPEDIYFDFTVTPPNERPPDLFIDVIGLPDNEKHGQYPGIFDYLFRVFELDFGKKLHYWAFLIWDRIIMTVSFHDPWSCKCENCISALRIWNQRALQPRIPNSTRSRRYVR